MAPLLSIDDFKPLRATCELRYSPAYLIYDRTGLVFHSLRNAFTDLKVVNAAPTQSVFQSAEGGLALELEQCRFSSEKLDSSLEDFSKHCKTYFDTVATLLETEVYTRIGFRTLFRKEFPSIDDANAALASVKLLNLEPAERFGIANPPNEIHIRWQSKDVGTLLAFRTEKTTFDLTLPPELEAATPEIKKVSHLLIVDIDHYTVAPVARSQWDPVAWIPQTFRRIKKEADKLLAHS